MASHGQHHSSAGVAENVRLGQSASGLKFGALVVGLVALAVAVAFGLFVGSDRTAGHARFYHGYLVGIAFCLSIALGGLFFTLIQHMVKVGWSVNVRRVPETLAATLPYLGLLTIPLLIPVLGLRGGELYPWAVPHAEGAGHHAAAHPAAATPKPVPEAFVAADEAPAKQAAAAHPTQEHREAAGSTEVASPKAADSHPAGDGHGDAAHGEAGHAAGHGADNEHATGTHARYDYTTYDDMTADKQPWLSSTFFTIRIVAYFAIWTLIAYYFYGQSKRQDATGDVEISKRLAVVAPICIIAFALTTTFAAFDLVMSLDHHWFSTIFGVYFFSGGMIGMFATTIVTYRYLQSKGLVTRSVSTEHYHDLGKFLFAFVFFWSYIAFSQFMLQWYAALPEEIGWWARRGVTSANESVNTVGVTSGFAGLSLVLMLGHFLLPFAYLISRHVKRSKEALLVGAGWMLFAHLVDMYWLVMPEYNNGEWVMDVTVLAAIVGVISLFVFFFLQILGTANLRPIGDPRADESMAFVNM